MTTKSTDEKTTKTAKADPALTARIAELENEVAALRGRQVVIPEGYVLMPVVPDEEMMLAGSDDQDSAWDSDANCRAIRRRVLASVTEVLLKRDNAALLAQG